MEIPLRRAHASLAILLINNVMSFRYSILPNSILPTVVFALLLLTAGATQAQPLSVYLAASTNAPGPDDTIDYTLMVTNSGNATLSNVRIEARFPSQIARFNESDVVGSGLDCDNFSNCDPNGNAAWDVGTLLPGENRQLTYPTHMASDASGTATTRLVASADDLSDIVLTHVVEVDPSPLLRVSAVPDHGPAVPGSPFTYAVTYGNVGNSNPTGVVLTMPVPAGTTFEYASNGGVEADGLVTWNLGTIGVGAGGRVETTVLPAATLPQGSVLEAEATIDSGAATELAVTSTAVTEVGPREALHLAASVSQNVNGTTGPSAPFTVTLTATNTNTEVDLDNVRVEMRLPPQIARFNESDVVGSGLDCDNFSNCDSNGNAVWVIPTLAARQSRTIILPMRIAEGALQGDVLRAFMRVTATDLNEQTNGFDLVVDPSPAALLELIPGPGPVTAGAQLSYTLTFSNIGFRPTDVTLTMPVPEGTAFASATGGGTVTEEVVTWRVADVTEEGTGRVELAVDVSPTLPDGTILTAEALLTTGSATEYDVRASAAVPVRGDIPLQIAYTANRSAAQPGDPVEFTMVAENTGTADLTDVAVELRFPSQIARFNESEVVGSGLDCDNFSNCDPNGNAVWDVGILAPGQTRTIIMPTSIASNASEGTFLLSPVVATATGSNEVILYNDVLLGEAINFAPSAAALIRPEDGASFLIGSNGDDDPISADSAFTVEWTAATDPEGDALTYTWQFSPSDSFDDLLIEAPSADAGTATHFMTNFGTLDSLLDANDIDVGASLTLYHRVVATDGSNTVYSEPFSVELTRGVLVDTEDAPGVPAAFVLRGNYPNPFSRSTTFAFELPEPAHVTLSVFDLLGREVSTVLSARMMAGTFEQAWSADDLAAGVYVYRLEAGSSTATGRLVVLR